MELEDEYNRNPNQRLNEARIIYEDKKIEEIQESMKRIEHKCNKIISMLTAHDYACEKRNRK
jgi:hypothetical protein